MENQKRPKLQGPIKLQRFIEINKYCINSDVSNKLKLLLTICFMLTYSCFIQSQNKISYCHEYVDLGLVSGTQWATMNIGAKTITEKGDLFAWGETSTNSIFDVKNYKFFIVNLTTNGTYDYFITKYYFDDENEESGYNGIVDNKFVLDPEDDVAMIQWGKEWRMPTANDWKELLDGCNWQWCEKYNGTYVSGYIGKSKTNGHTIFLPQTTKNSGFYWSSTLNDAPYNSSDNVGEAIGLYISEDELNVYYHNRWEGFAVRAVRRL